MMNLHGGSNDLKIERDGIHKHSAKIHLDLMKSMNNTEIGGSYTSQLKRIATNEHSGIQMADHRIHIHSQHFILESVTAPSEILGRKKIYVQHKSDILRLLILKEFGGIYLDTDELLFKSVDTFGNQDCTSRFLFWK